MKIRLEDGLPHVTVVLSYRGQQVSLAEVLLDTGSAGTIFSTDRVLAVGLTMTPQDTIRRVRGVGGTEFVFTKRVDRLALDDFGLDNFEIEVGAMQYGVELDGIMGVDFLTRVGAVIDLAQMKVYSTPQKDKNNADNRQ